MAITAKITNQSRAIQVLQGYLKGIASDQLINKQEFISLQQWIENHKDLSDLYPFADLYQIVKNSLKDGEIDPGEMQELLDFCNEFEALNGPIDKLTAEMRTLHGFVHGLIVDGKVDDKELEGLRLWMNSRLEYKNNWPFNEIYKFVASVLEDGVITPEENNSIVAFFTNFAEVKAENAEAEKALYDRGYLVSEAPILDTIDYIISKDHAIEIIGSNIVVTGQFESAKREIVESRIKDSGGIVHNSVKMDTDYVVIGALSNRCWAYSTYGRKIEKAMEFNQKYNSRIIFLDEKDFMIKLK